MAPICSNCGGTDFLWASELKTGGRLGSGPLSLRAAGELTLGSRICRTCGHADLFLKDVKILHNPSAWRPHEFVPIVAHAPAPPPRAVFPTPLLPASADAGNTAPSAWGSPAPSPGLAGPAAALPAPSVASLAATPAPVEAARPSEPAAAPVREAPPVPDSFVSLESSGGGPTVVVLSDVRRTVRPEPALEEAPKPLAPVAEPEATKVVREAESAPRAPEPIADRKVPAPRPRTNGRKRSARSK